MFNQITVTCPNTSTSWSTFLANLPLQFVPNLRSWCKRSFWGTESLGKSQCTDCHLVALLATLNKVSNFYWSHLPLLQFVTHRLFSAVYWFFKTLSLNWGCLNMSYWGGCGSDDTDFILDMEAWYQPKRWLGWRMHVSTRRPHQRMQRSRTSNGLLQPISWVDEAAATMS